MSSSRKSLVIFGLPFLAALSSFPFDNAFAADITVTNLSFPDWQFGPVFPPDPTFATFATGECPPCSETASEPVGDFAINVPFDNLGGLQSAGFFIGLLKSNQHTLITGHQRHHHLYEQPRDGQR